MTKNNPTISVVMPVYNAENYVRQAVESVLNQTYQNIELILINDGSTDNSLSVIQAYVADERVKILTQKNSGACVARNRGLNEAEGEFVKFLDADDVLYPNIIEEQLKEIQPLAENEIVFGDFDFIDSEGEITYEYVFNKNDLLQKDPDSFFLNNWEILISSPLHRKQLLKNVGGFDESLKSGQEQDLHFRLALSGVKFIYKSIRAFQYRSHLSETRISVNRMTKQIPDFERIKNRNNKYISLLCQKNGELSDAQKLYFADAYFGSARRFFVARELDKGKYCLKCARELSKHGIPRFKKNRLFGFVYLALGCIIGYCNIERLLSKRGKEKKKNNDDLIWKVLEPNR